MVLSKKTQITDFTFIKWFYFQNALLIIKKGLQKGVKKNT